MDRLKLAEMLGFFYGVSDKYPKVSRFIKEIADYLYAPVNYDANATQHTDCVGNALDALEEPQRAYEQGVKDTLDKYDETCRIVSEIRMAVGCKTAKECRELIRNGEIQRVKHGKWVMNKRSVYECSICGRVPTAEQKQYDRYCSWCGAKMDEVDK